MSKRLLAVLLATALLLSCAILAILGASAPFSPSGWIDIVVLGLAAAALIVRQRRARWTLAVIAAVLLAGVLAARIALADRGRIRLLTLPSSAASRWAGRLIDEQDVSLLGARALHMTWRLTPAEQKGLTGAMHDAYVELRADQTVTASPVVDTLLQRQSPEAFDTIVIEPPGAPQAGVVFLHGYAGSFTLECWLVAKAAQAIGAVTVCPAVDFSGHWSGPNGEETVRRTIAYLHARGITKLYLAGLSNGGVGASALAPRFASDLSGLIVISGAPWGGGSGGLPTLVVQGDHDAMSSPATARAFAVRTHATYSGFEGGHFVMVMRRKEVREAIAVWLRRH